jgi:GNAT superfamily N-acetyltransferase
VLARGDVGHRVAIRRIVTDGEGCERLSELVGELIDLTATNALIAGGSGRISVPLVTIVAGRRVPDRRALTATERLEQVASAGWPAPQQDRIGDWLLRAAEGWTARANSALPVGLPGRPLSAAIDAVSEWYLSRKLQPAIMVPEPVGRRLTAELSRRGWTPDPGVLVQTAPLGTITAAATGCQHPVQLDLAPEETWLERVAAAKGTPRASALAVLTGVSRCRFARVCRADGSITAIGRGVVADDGEWLGISLVEVVGSERRRGLATAVVGALARWAGQEGASRAYLQVLADNVAAISLYDRLGFTTHHRYTTWRDPAATPNATSARC